MTLSQKDYAAHRGVTPGRVTQWKTAGRLVLAADGKINVAASDALLAETDNPMMRRAPRQREGSAAQSAAEPQNRPLAPVVGRAAAKQAEESGSMTFVRIRTAHEAIKTKEAELDYMARKGELVEKNRYDRSLADALGPILGKLDALPTRIVAQVGEQEARRVQIAVEKEVREVRTEIAQALRALALSAAGQTRQ